MTSQTGGVVVHVPAPDDGNAPVPLSPGAPSAAPSRPLTGSAAVPLPGLIAAGRPVLVHDKDGDWLGWTVMVPDSGREPCHVTCRDPYDSPRRPHVTYLVPWRRLAQPN